MLNKARSCVQAAVAALIHVALLTQGAQAQPQVAGKTVMLAPHRAVYDILLDQSRGGSGVSDMSGRMVYELLGSECEGFTQNMRFVTRTTNQEGLTSVTDMRSNSTEDAQAKTFRFHSTQYKDGKLSETTVGDVVRADPAGEGKVELTKPEKKEIALKQNVLFPIQHSMALLAAAKNGSTIFQADLYDGSEKGEKVYGTTAYIAQPRPPGHNKKLRAVPPASVLDDLRSWPVSISYFEPGATERDAVPAYELAFLYFENGVSRRLYIDYGDFSIRGTLSAIQFLEPGRCDAKP